MHQLKKNTIINTTQREALLRAWGHQAKKLEILYELEKGKVVMQSTQVNKQIQILMTLTAEIPESANSSVNQSFSSHQ